MGEHRRKLNAAEKFAGESLRKGVVSYAQCTGFQGVDFTEFIALRAELKEAGTPVSSTALFAKAMGVAMQDFPTLNSILVGSDELVTYDEVNVGIGVSTDHGLLIVVVKDVGNKSIFVIQQELTELIERAKTNKLKPEDVYGATITLSNLSTTKSEFFTSAIVGNQTMLIGFSGIMKKPVVKQGEIVIRDMANIMVNMNHTAAQGLHTTLYLSRVAEILEAPREYFLS